MLLRISLVVAILAGLGALYFGHFPVAEKISRITTERDDAQKAQQTAQAAEAKARADAKKAKEESDKAKLDLAAKAQSLDETTAKLTQQEKRANQQFEELTAKTKDLNESRQQLAAFLTTGVKPEQIIELRDNMNKVAKERDAFVAENSILLRNVKRLESELARYTGDREVEVPLPTGLKGKVLAVDPKYDFVVLDIGGNQGVVERGQMLVNRDGKLVAKVRITKVEPNRCIANILPEWKQGEVMEGDQVLY